MFRRLFGLFNFNTDIGIDLGTANTLVYLKDEGIEYLREYLNLPEEIVPATLKKSTRPVERRPEGPGGRGPPGGRGGGFGRDSYRGGGPPRGGFGRGAPPA